MSPTTNPLALPRERTLNTQLSRAKRFAMIDESMGWPGDDSSPAHTWIYHLDSSYSVGVKKPGKEADSNRRYVNPFDMLPVIRHGEIRVPFDAGFNGIFRALYDIGTQSAHSRQEEAAQIFGGVLYRAAWALDHVSDSAGKVRLTVDLSVRTAIERMPSRRIQTPTEEYDLPAWVLLHFLEALALNEDVKYFNRRGALHGSTGRPSTYKTCARALACGLGAEHPMDFAYGLSRGNGVAGLSRGKAETYFPALKDVAP